MTPTVEEFRALARSSPWRWTTLHFRHRSSWTAASTAGLEAWIVRPDGIRVVGTDGRSYGPSLMEQRADGRPTAPWRPPTPSYRLDGLVAVRPASGSYHDAMLSEGLFWNSYGWQAMLDPVELSHHVAVERLRVDQVAGRPAWRADLRAELGYDPLCGGNCCELIYSEAALRADFPEPEDVPAGWAGRDYPDHYDVALDVATGVVARCLPVGGDPASAWLENDILEVDVDLHQVID